MLENVTLVILGTRELIPAFSDFIGYHMSRTYRNNWWNEVLRTLNYPTDIPSTGEYSKLVESLDLLNCCRLLQFKWRDVFQATNINKSCLAWANELKAYRNIVSHKGQGDIEQPLAERALDTMVLLCQEIDPEAAERIREIYKEVRSRAVDSVSNSIIAASLAQPASESARGALQEGSLLNLIDSDIVVKTSLTRKITFGGKTTVYPVYKVRLDALYYNDQNDRIATWITKYESENGEDSLSGLNKEIYNRTIEDFIVDSNPESIAKTQKNISLVGQREPGVTLADGRIVDGNRRFTCLRKNRYYSNEPLYFETVIIDMDIQADKKQIKLLELAIQHGEEKKVDYDGIDFAIGTYRDIVKTNLLTVEEYAAGTNEPVSEVKKRIDIAKLICDFLEHINRPEQYHVAREYQVFDLFKEMLPVLKQLDSTEHDQLKTIAFNNVLMNTLTDRRKFIRDIKGLVKSGAYKDLFAKHQSTAQEIRDKFENTTITGKESLDSFANENKELAIQLQAETENALQASRTIQLKNKPAETVTKCISLMMDIDTRLFANLNPDDKETLTAALNELTKITESFKNTL